MATSFISPNYYPQKFCIHNALIQLLVIISFYMYLLVTFPFYFINSPSSHQNRHTSSLCPEAKRASWYIFSFLYLEKVKSIDYSFANWHITRFISTVCFVVPYFLFFTTTSLIIIFTKRLFAPGQDGVLPIKYFLSWQLKLNLRLLK